MQNVSIRQHKAKKENKPSRNPVANTSLSRASTKRTGQTDRSLEHARAREKATQEPGPFYIHVRIYRLYLPGDRRARTIGSLRGASVHWIFSKLGLSRAAQLASTVAEAAICFLCAGPLSPPCCFLVSSAGGEARYRAPDCPRNWRAGVVAAHGTMGGNKGENRVGIYMQG